MGKLSWREPTGQHSENSWETIANPVLNSYTKTRNHRKALRKTQKTTIYWNQKNSKYQNTSYVGARFFAFSLARGRGSGSSVMPLIRCISNMNSHKFFWQSHTSQSVRFSKRRTQPACCEYIDTIVGMRLDRPSYWDSLVWTLVGRLWRYHHESLMKLNL